MAARADFICTYGRERADRRPVDDPLRSDVPAQTPRSDPPEQRPRPDLDPDQIDPAVDRGQIDVAGAYQLRAVLVDDLTIEHVVRKGDVRRPSLDGPGICRWSSAGEADDGSATSSTQLAAISSSRLPDAR